VSTTLVGGVPDPGPPLPQPPDLPPDPVPEPDVPPKPDLPPDTPPTPQVQLPSVGGYCTLPWAGAVEILLTVNRASEFEQTHPGVVRVGRSLCFDCSRGRCCFSP
jgi:hypothetical protein